MKTLPSFLVLAYAGILATLPVIAQETTPGATVKAPAAPRPRTSPHETVGAVIDGNRVTVIYGRPYAKDPKSGERRKIWGTLVPYGKVWRAGSDEATLLVTQQPLVFGSTTVPAGAYTLWVLPAADGSAKLIVNKEVGQWGIDRNGTPLRNEKFDVAQVDLKKDTLETAVDQFTIAVGKNQAGNGGAINLLWDTTQYTADFTVAK